jgi:hypothetical protein
MTLAEQAEKSAFPNTFRAGVAAAISIIDQHIPSLTDEDDDAIAAVMKEWDLDYGDLAIRTCACGVKIDGFYEYVDHLKEVLK